MAKGNASWTGLSDSRPSSSPTQKPNEGGHESGGKGVGDWKGEFDSRPSSSPTSPQKIPVSGGKG